MSIPNECTVLVIGGGPGGSYAAAALAREGINTVLLEAEVFPRYHVGESMLASMRHFLRFIDLDSAFDQYGFKKKVGAAFKLNQSKREGYTDFIAAGGPSNYAWNVVRSESDDLMFRHAGKSGAKIYDGVKVNAISFEPLGCAEMSSSKNAKVANLGRPVSASYTGASLGVSGNIKFEYLIDASGRAGLVSVRYLKNRSYNQGMKNIANWGYWEDTKAFAEGTARADSPFFEALTDESGWAWLIPLHNGTTSVGTVMNQNLANSKKKSFSSTESFYSATLKLAPNISLLLASGRLTTDIKSASDYSYSSSSYALPNLRVVGDAGCFIDPYFSSGVHLALASALSAATTICAARRGDCEEATAAKWHSQKVTDGYERFRLVVMSAYRQIRRQEEPVLSDFDQDNFDRAFALFRPIIQGSADTSDKLTHAKLSETLDFCANAFSPVLPKDRAAVLKKMAAIDSDGMSPSTANGQSDRKDDPLHANLTAEEQYVVKHIQARKMMRTEDTMGIASFTTDVIDGLAPHLHQGCLGLVPRVSA